MPKKSKLKKQKCPACKSSKYVEHDHHDCPSCNCGDIYYCNNCLIQFDSNGDKF